MELHQVRYFLALSETRNFTRAAERCHVSQPSLTRAIQALEAEFGEPLFHRERQRTHLTDFGRTVQPYLEEVWRQAEAARSRAKSFALLDSVELRVGLMCTLGPSRLMRLIEPFRAGNPGLTVSLCDATGASLDAQLESGALDVAIFALPEIGDGRHALPLFTERFVIAVGPGHPFEQLAGVTMADLHRENYLQRTNCEFGAVFHRLLAERCIEPLCLYRSEREDWIQAMAHAGLGFAVVPEYAITAPGLSLRPLVEPELSRTVSLVTMRGRPHAPAVGAFVRHAVAHRWREDATG